VLRLLDIQTREIKVREGCHYSWNATHEKKNSPMVSHECEPVNYCEFMGVICKRHSYPAKTACTSSFVAATARVCRATRLSDLNPRNPTTPLFSRETICIFKSSKPFISIYNSLT